MEKRIHIWAVLISVLVLAGGVARADVIFGVLDFGPELQLSPGDPFSVSSFYNNEYVTFASGVAVGFGGDPYTLHNTLNWEDDVFGGLKGVAWSQTGVPTRSIPGELVGSISFIAQPGYAVMIDSFKLAAFATGSSKNLAVEILDEHGAYVFHQKADAGVSNAGFTEIVPMYNNPPTHGFTKLTLQWLNPRDVAIDDIMYSVRLVPEPVTLVTWGLGLAGLGFVAYRRRRQLR